MFLLLFLSITFFVFQKRNLFSYLAILQQNILSDLTNKMLDLKKENDKTINDFLHFFDI